MSDQFQTTTDPNSGQTLAWVCGEDGVPKPCIEQQLGYAIGLGYRQCNPPGVKSEAAIVAPEPVQTYGQEPATANEEPSAEVIEPDDTPANRKKKSR